MYFNLKSECYFVRGKYRSVIYNLANGEAVHLMPEESELVFQTQKGEQCTEASVFQELCDIGFGFFSEKRYFIDKLRPYNNFMLLRPDLKTPNLNVAFLQLTTQCHNSYTYCRSMFCTPCRQGKSLSTPLPLSDWTDIIDNLRLSGVNQIILTGGDVTLYDDLSALITYIISQQINVCAVMNPLSKYTEKIPHNVPVIIYHCTQEEPEQVIRRFKKYKNVTVICNEKTSTESKQAFTEAKFTISSVMAYSTEINKKKMMPCYLNMYFMKKDNNNCLNEKMYINTEGKVIPCLQSESEIIGSALSGDFQDTYRKLILEYWRKPYKHEKCNDCEWYFSCPVCMYMSPQDTCVYDTETAKWE